MFVRLLLAFLAIGLLAAGATLALRDAGILPPVLLIALLAAALAWLFARRLARPLREVGAAADRIADGDYTRRLNPGPWAECRELARRFNEMTARVAGRVGGLAAE